MSNVVEMVTFKLAESASKADLVSTNEAMNAFLKTQEGLIYRSLCESEDGTFTDIVYWENMDNALTAQKAFFESDLCKAFSSYIIEESVELKHVKVIAAYGCDKE